MTDKKTILIIEDEPTLAGPLAKRLENAGLTVVIAKDGVEGLTLALKHKPDLILLDLLMPRLKGMEMLKELRKEEWGAGVQVFVLTNFESSEMIAEANALGVIDYLVKANLNLEELVWRVQAVVNPETATDFTS